ncbi:protein-disulfide reductase DsbD family protein [Cytophagaceae bacterium ABcell3]|nr:protein-disulfide reductase DsbD family protein [Cytophagaceae bacterium ABcell3]
MRKISLLVLLTIATIVSAFAQGANPASWSYETSKSEVKAGETIELIFKADIKQPWYMYSSDFELDGPMPTEFSFEPHPSYQIEGDVQAINPKTKYSEIFEGDYTYFTEKAEFRQKVRVLEENPVIAVEITYQVCSDKDGKCIYFEEEHAFDGINVVQSSIAPEKQPSKPEKQPSDDTKADNGKIEEPTNERVEELVKEREQYISRDQEGRDESVIYLRNFVRKHGN